MKLILGVVSCDGAGPLLDALNRAGHQVTIICTTGGFLRQSNITILLALQDESIPGVLDLIRRNCGTRNEYVNPIVGLTGIDAVSLLPLEILTGGATVFVLKVDDVLLL
jgi:uncharacterized protein YaaQ